MMNFLRSLWKNKLWLLLVPAITVGAIYAYYNFTTDTYSSSATLATNLKEQSGSQTQIMDIMDLMNSELTVHLLSYKLLLNDLANEKDAYRKISRYQINEMIKEYPNLYYDNEKDHVAEIKKLLKRKLEKFEKLNPDENEYNKLIADILQSYKYQPEELSRYLEINKFNEDGIKVKAGSENPELSAFMVNSFAREFIRYYENLQLSQKVPKELGHQLAEKKRLLDEKNRYLNQLKNTDEENFNLDYNISQLKDFTIKKDNLLDEIRSLQMQIESTNAKIQESQTATNSRSSNARIIQLQNKINEINQLYVNSGSTNQELLKTLEQLRGELRSEMSKAASSSDGSGLSVAELTNKKEDLELKLRISRSNLTSIDANIKNLNRSISGLSSTRSSIREAEQDVEKSMNEYLAVLDVYNKTTKDQGYSAHLELVTPGVPEAPHHEHAIRTYSFAGAGSLMLVVMLIFIGTMADSTIKNQKRFRNKVRVKLAGLINEISSEKIDLGRLFSKDQDNEEYERFKQQLRKVRNELLSYKEDKIFLFTSPKKGEGKSFLILCLAYSLSLLDKRVLIVDTNFKNNTLTELLTPEAVETSLVELKRKLITDPDFGKSPVENRKDQELLQAYNPEFFEEASSPAIPVYDNIDIIGSKRVSNSPSEIFAGKHFDSLLSELSLQYDYIFMEGPALNEYSDTLELASYVDKVVPIFSAKTSIKQKDRDSIINLKKKINGKLANAVLNKVRLSDLDV